MNNATATHHCRPPACSVPGYSLQCEGSHAGEAHKSICGLQTIAVSHVATFIPLVFGFVLTFAALFRSQAGVEERFIVGSVGLTTIVALSFYFLGFLVVEERHTWKLRVLTPFWRAVEIVMRVVILGVFVERMIHLAFGGSLITTLVLVATIYAAFLGWDVLLYKARRDKRVADWGRYSRELRLLSEVFAPWDLLFLVLAVLMIVAYEIRSLGGGALVVTVVLTVLSGAALLAWGYTFRDDLGEFWRRVKALEFR